MTIASPAYTITDAELGERFQPIFDGTSYSDPTDVTRPLWGEANFPRLPDIEADPAQDPASWDVVSWDLEPGDALVFHSGTLHGGAPVTPDSPERRTLVPRFFGDKVFYRPLPTDEPGLPARHPRVRRPVADSGRAVPFPLLRPAALTEGEAVMKEVVPAWTRSMCEAYHFAPAVVDGEHLRCSGMVGLRPDLSVPEDPTEQFTLAFENLCGLLAEVGLTFADVVEMTSYHVALREHVDAFVAVKDAFTTAPYPAWTAVGVAELAFAGALVEIQVLARIPR